MVTGPGVSMALTLMVFSSNELRIHKKGQEIENNLVEEAKEGGVEWGEKIRIHSNQKVNTVGAIGTIVQTSAP